MAFKPGRGGGNKQRNAVIGEKGSPKSRVIAVIRRLKPYRGFSQINTDRAKGWRLKEARNHDPLAQSYLGFVAWAGVFFEKRRNRGRF